MSIKSQKSAARGAIGILMLGAGFAALATAAQAQAPDTTVADIVVTGSRAASGGFVAPTPTTVLGGAALDQRQSTNIAQILNELPAFKATTSPAANAIRTQTPGSSTADLRGLGAARTLVLVNGARIPPLAAANNTGAPVAADLNTVPSLMVDRIEVVTGGASAQWGSDAVAGVVNILLKNRFEGLEMRAQAGESQRGDAENGRVAILGGLAFGGGGHLVAGFDYVKQKEVGDVYTRDWGSREYGRVSNAAFATNGQAANIITTGVHAATSPGGLITGPATFSLRNFEFLPGGQVSPFDIGGIRNASLQIGGQGASIAKGVSLAPGVERFNPYARLEYELGETTVFVEGSYGISIGRLTVLPSRDAGVTILADNAYLPAAVRSALGAAPSFTMTRINYDLGNAKVKVKNRTPRFAVGAKGALGDDWTWDAGASIGRNHYRNEVRDNRNIANYRFAADAVLSGGQIVCRATLPGPAFNAAAAGCTPINLFGAGSPSAAAISYVTGRSRLTADYSQETAAANIRGEPFSTWAGPVSVAAGVEYRHEKEVVGADPVALIGGFEASNGTAFKGSFNVKEGYVEAIVPLARDVPGLRKLDFNGAVRVADYSAAGTQTTWKVGATWEPLEGLRFRTTRSRDIRAPALYELYGTGTVSNLPATVRGVTAANIPQNSTIGSLKLDPEQGDTFTFGLVLQPAALAGLSVSVDYYDIKLKKAITSVTAATAGTLCTAGQAYYCGLFTFAGATPTAFNSPYINAAALNPKGLDIAANYRVPLSNLSDNWAGVVSINFTGTHTYHAYSDLGNGSAPIDYAGDNSGAGTPRFRSNTSITYALNGLSVTGQLVTISAGHIDNTANLNAATSINTNRVPKFGYANLQASYDINQQYRVFGSINNLLDRDPPSLPSATLFTLTNGVYYDTIGRSFTVGVNVRF